MTCDHYVAILFLILVLTGVHARIKEVSEQSQLIPCNTFILVYCRCHTFGIGSEVCIELVTGIATISGGKCVLLKEGERLQAKVSILK